MKNYFKFNLTGKELFPVWILFLILYCVPAAIVRSKIQTVSKFESTDMAEIMLRGLSLFKLYGISGILFIVEYFILFYIYKMVSYGIEFKEKTFGFVAKSGRFMSVFITNFLLTIITFGIYSPWFMTNMLKFFAENSKYDDQNPEFKGKGSDLLVIILSTLVIPVCVIMSLVLIVAIIGGSISAMKSPDFTTMTPLMLISIGAMVVGIFIIMLPFTYYFYKWFVNFSFKGYQIRWETEFWSSIQKLFVEIGLSIITLGIYSPLATVKLYKYFAERTVAIGENSLKHFGYDIESGDDFLFIWGQILLSVITLGIYCPWAICKIGNRILGKTYVEG